MDNLRGLLGIMRVKRVLNARIICGVKKGLDEGVFLWFSHVDRVESLCRRMRW